MLERVPAVVLAGARAEPEMASRYSVEYRSDIVLAGRTMLEHVVDALSASPVVGEIYVVGHTAPAGVRVIPPRENLIENLIAGFEAIPSDCHVLVVTSDIPMLTAEAVTGFVRQCGDLDVDFFYSIVPKMLCKEKFPGMHRTYVRLAEGEFTGGNAFIMRHSFVTQNAETLQAALRFRKQPLKLAMLIGLGTLLRALIAQKIWAGAITINQVERAAGRVLKCRVKAVPVPYPELGADVDSVEHAESIEKMLGSRGPDC